jgi:hypothetical protein
LVAKCLHGSIKLSLPPPRDKHKGAFGHEALGRS